MFDAISGDTHLLDDLSLHLLERVNAHAATTQELAQQASSLFEGGFSAEQVEFVQASLLQLQSVGLVTRNTP